MSLADTFIRPVQLWCYGKWGVRRTMTIFFTMAIVGSFPVIFSEGASENYRDYVVPVCLFVMNSGVSASFANIYVGHLDLFPVVFASTSMGFCNIIARFTTIFAPMVAEVDQPVPEIIFTTVCVIAAVVSLFVRKKTSNYY